MAKFNVLYINQRFMSELGIHVNQLTKSNKSFRSNLILLNLIFAIIVGAVNAFKSSNLSYRVNAFVALFGTCQPTGILMSIRAKTDQIDALHRKLQAIVDQGSFLLWGSEYLLFNNVKHSK